MSSFVSRPVILLAVSAALCAQNAPDLGLKIAALEQQVQKALQEQKPAEAIPPLREIASLDPRNVNGRANLGVLLFFQGGFAEAIPHLRAALQLQPGLVKIQALLGIAEKRTGDPQAAQEDLERAFPKLEDKKIQAEAGLELIEIYSAAAQFEKALSVAVKLEESDPRNPQALFAVNQISRQLMDQTLLSLMTVAPDSAEIHMIMARDLARQGDRTAAIAQFREALRVNPNVPGAHFELAEQLRTSTDPALNAQAEDEYKAALKVNQYDELSWRQLGGVMNAKGDFKGAENCYEKALALQPKDSDAQTGLAIVLISMNQTDKALALLESAVVNDPTNTVAHYRLSGLYRRAGRTADAERELGAFHHYTAVKDKLGEVYKQLAAPPGPR